MGRPGLRAVPLDLRAPPRRAPRFPAAPAVYTIVASTTLPYPPDAAFAALASIESSMRWQAGVHSVHRARAAAADPDGVPPLVLHY